MFHLVTSTSGRMNGKAHSSMCCSTKETKEIIYIKMRILISEEVWLDVSIVMPSSVMVETNDLKIYCLKPHLCHL